MLGSKGVALQEIDQAANTEDPFLATHDNFDFLELVIGLVWTGRGL